MPGQRAEVAAQARHGGRAEPAWAHAMPGPGQIIRPWAGPAGHLYARALAQTHSRPPRTSDCYLSRHVSPTQSPRCAAASAAASDMELRELGATGLRVSPVGFGASPLGHVFGDVPRDVARAAVRRARDLGINFFDTSPYVPPPPPPPPPGSRRI